MERFATLAEPLHKLKSLLFHGTPLKGKARRSFATSIRLSGSDNKEYNELLAHCQQSWDTLRERLTEAPTLAYPDFSKPFILYVDGSLEYGFGVAVHQFDNDGVERPVLFLSKGLTPAERNYGSMELECAAVVWTLLKLPHYVDGDFQIVTNHSILVNALQEKHAGCSSCLN